jgi:hypothetical protein
LIISIKGSRGTRMLKTPLAFEAFWGFGYSWIYTLPFPFLLFSACTNSKNDGSNCSAWNCHPLEPSCCCLCDLTSHHTFLQATDYSLISSSKVSDKFLLLIFCTFGLKYSPS